MTGHCLGCNTPIHGNDFIDSLEGYVICFGCRDNGCTMEPSSLRLIYETRLRVRALGSLNRADRETAWALIMAEVRAELEGMGIPVYVDAGIERKAVA